MNQPSHFRGETPAGYQVFQTDGATVVAQEALAPVLRAALAEGPLLAFAARQTGARPLQGRGVAWSITLANGVEAVVRHSRHGGALAQLTGDLFLYPTRAPHELRTALRLAEAGVATPSVLAYVIYPAFGPFCRSDVVTGTLAGDDFPAVWAVAPTAAARDSLLAATGQLLRALQAAGAVHPDLNLKNIFCVTGQARPVAAILDVDRVWFRDRGDRETGRQNFHRLAQSARKWRDRRGLAFSEADLQQLAQAAGVTP